MEQSALFATMSGTNLMVVTTVLLETGMVAIVEPVTTLQLEVPAGLIEVTAHCRDGRVTLVEFENVPSFATAVDVPIEVPGFGTVPVSVAWGGMACAVVDADALGLELVPDQARSVGEAIVGGLRRRARADRLPAPAQPGADRDRGDRRDGPPPRSRGNHARQTCGIPTGQMDTSPSGTGTSAGMAVLRARGALAVGQPFRTEGAAGRRLPLRDRPRDDGRRRRGDRPADRRPRLDHGLRPLRAAGRRSVSRGLRHGRHLARRERGLDGRAPRGGTEANVSLRARSRRLRRSRRAPSDTSSASSRRPPRRR